MNIGELKRILDESGLEDDTVVLIDEGDIYELWEARIEFLPIWQRKGWFFKSATGGADGQIIPAVVISGH